MLRSRIARKGFVCPVSAIVTFALFAVAAHAGPPRKNEDFSITVDAAQQWQASGICVYNDDVITVLAKGWFEIGPPPEHWYNWIGPAGTDGCAGTGALLPGANGSCLIAKIGPSGDPFPIGEFKMFVADASGELYFAINDSYFVDNSGSLKVFVWGGDLLITNVPTDPGAGFDQSRLPSPNPFRSEVALSYSLSRPSAVNLSVHDAQGRLVTTLFDGIQPSGEHEAIWDGLDQAGAPVPAGVYFYHLQTEDSQRTHKVVLTR